jgi:cobalt-zinc-cadmium efflux system protein
MAHDHSHDHHHHAAPETFTTAFVVAITLNLALVVGQVVGGLWAHSLALVADAGHNFIDVVGLMLAWWARRLQKSAPTRTHTYGLRSMSILASLTNAVLVLVSMGAVGWEAIVRLGQPAPVDGPVMIGIAVAAILVNGVSAWPFLAGRKEDLNLKAAFAHLAADAGIAAGVALAGVAILMTGVQWIDPVASLAIVAVVIYGTWGLLRDSMNLALQAVPPGIDLRAIHDYLAAASGVGNVHDLHVWAMSTTETALTVHLVLQPGHSHEDVLAEVTQGLHDRFKISHTTVQVELPEVAPLVYQRRVSATPADH